MSTLPISPAPVPGLMVPPETSTAAGPSADAAGLLAVDWLAAWLGQTGESPDLPDEAPEPASETAASPAPVAFLTLYPSVPMLPPADSADSADEASEPVAVPSTPDPASTLIAAPVVAPAAQPEAAPVNPAVPLPVPVPVETANPAITLSESTDANRQDSPDSSRRGSTFRSADPLPPPPSPAEPVPDRGEIIWNAELVVAEPASPAPTASESARLSPEPVLRQAAAPIPPPAAPPRQEAPPAPPQNETPAPAALSPETASRNAGDSPDSRHSPSEDRESAPRHAPSHTPESTVAAPERPHFNLHPSNSAHASAEPVAEVAAPQPAEPARPLRPAQVATVRVDLPNDSLPADTPALRLTVTQRGDQVNVQLRSWDTTAAPIEGHRMESLLNTLADQGYVERSTETRAIDADLIAATEGVRERAPLVENSDLSDTRQSFANQDERRQQNQERQQQQQANFLRRQLRHSQSQSFDFHPIPSENINLRY